MNVAEALVEVQRKRLAQLEAENKALKDANAHWHKRVVALKAEVALKSACIDGMRDAAEKLAADRDALQESLNVAVTILSTALNGNHPAAQSADPIDMMKEAVAYVRRIEADLALARAVLDSIEGQGAVTYEGDGRVRRILLADDAAWQRWQEAK
jgi:hypothetical protein